jgi:hypothetical protein
MALMGGAYWQEVAGRRSLELEVAGAPSWSLLEQESAAGGCRLLARGPLTQKLEEVRATEQEARCLSWVRDRAGGDDTGFG